MDLSGLIFVALAVAWAAYLIPKALRHHEDVARARTVEEFSDHLRVLARREPVSARAARLVVSKTRSEAGRTTTAGAAVVETDAPLPTESAQSATAAPMVLDAPAEAEPADPSTTTSPPVRRTVRRSAARRRRRVLSALLVLLVVVGGGVVTGHLATGWLAGPMVLLVAWLVACRVMVKGELRTRAARPTASAPMADEGHPTAGTTAADAGETDAEAPAGCAADAGDAAATEATEPTASGSTAPGLWDPLPMTLPTYVSKQKATRRTVRTIDLDDSDVWTSGRTDVDAALAREAEAQRPPVAPEEPGDGRRAVGH